MNVDTTDRHSHAKQRPPAFREIEQNENALSGRCGASNAQRAPQGGARDHAHSGQPLEAPGVRLKAERRRRPGERRWACPVLLHVSATPCDAQPCSCVQASTRRSNSSAPGSGTTPELLDVLQRGIQHEARHAFCNTQGLTASFDTFLVSSGR